MADTNPIAGNFRLMASGNDIKAARATYEGFIQAVKVSTPVIIYLLAH